MAKYHQNTYDYSSDAPLKAQSFLCHIHFSLRKDVNPVAGGKLFYAQIHGRLIDASATYNRYALACVHQNFLAKHNKNNKLHNLMEYLPNMKNSE